MEINFIVKFMALRLVEKSNIQELLYEEMIEIENRVSNFVLRSE